MVSVPPLRLLTWTCLTRPNLASKSGGLASLLRPCLRVTETGNLLIFLVCLSIGVGWTASAFIPFPPTPIPIRWQWKSHAHNNSPFAYVECIFRKGQEKEEGKKKHQRNAQTITQLPLSCYFLLCSPLFLFFLTWVFFSVPSASPFQSIAPGLCVCVACISSASVITPYHLTQLPNTSLLPV